MKRNWQTDELIDQFTLVPPELGLLVDKVDLHRLAQAVLLKSFQLEGRFPVHKTDVPKVVVDFLAKQLRLKGELYLQYDWQGRSIKSHRAEIRAYLGFRESTDTDLATLDEWLHAQILRHDHDEEHLKALLYDRFRQSKLEPTTPARIERMIRSALRDYEEYFFQTVLTKLSPKTQAGLEALLTNPAQTLHSVEEVNADSATTASAEGAAVARPPLLELRTDPGKPGLETVLAECTKLKRLRELGLPTDLWGDTAPRVILRYAQRVATDTIQHLRRMLPPVKYTLLAAFCSTRSETITDNLVELLIDLIHRIGAKAERKVDKELIADFRRVEGKPNLLYLLAQATTAKPEGQVKEVVFPVVSEQTLKDVIVEHEAGGLNYRQKVYTVMKGSYGHHYRRMIPEILSVLNFRSNNQTYRPVIEALELITRYADSSPAQVYYPTNEKVPLRGVVKGNWLDLVVERSPVQRRKRINRIYYEICGAPRGVG